MGLQYVERVTSLESPGFTEAANDKVTVNGRLMVYLDGTYLTYPSGTAVGGGIWVPEDFRDAKVLGVYEGGVAYNAGVNSDWSWTLTGAAPVEGAPGAADETTFTSGGAANYVAIAPTFTTGHVLVYLNIKNTVAANADSCALLVEDHDVESKLYQLRFSESSTAGNIDWSIANCQEYAAGTGQDEWQVIIDPTNTPNNAACYKYDDYGCVTHGLKSNFGASSASRIRIGCLAAANGTLVLKGDPAVVILEARA